MPVQPTPPVPRAAPRPTPLEADTPRGANGAHSQRPRPDVGGARGTGQLQPKPPPQLASGGDRCSPLRTSAELHTSALLRTCNQQTVVLLKADCLRSSCSRGRTVWEHPSRSSGGASLLPCVGLARPNGRMGRSAVSFSSVTHARMTAVVAACSRAVVRSSLLRTTTHGTLRVHERSITSQCPPRLLAAQAPSRPGAPLRTLVSPPNCSST